MAKKSVKFKITNDEFSKFIGLITELNKISEEHRFIWDKDGILVYSIIGEEKNGKINVLKTFYISRDRLFSNMPKDLNLSYTMYNAKMFAKKFNFIMMSEDSEYDVTFNYDTQTDSVLLFEASNSTLEMRFTASENNIKPLSIEKKKQLMDKSMASTTFTMSVEDLEKIKKISKLEDSETIDLTIEKGEIKFGEAQWELVIKNDHDCEDYNCSFKKNYINAIYPGKDEIEFSIFPTYVLVDESKSQLLFTVELLD